MIEQVAVEIVQSARTQDFLGSLGVNTHITWWDTAYADLDRVTRSLAYLGIKRVRDTVPEHWPERFRQVAAAGVDFVFIVHGPLPEDAVAMIRPFSGSVAAVEGPNEANTWPVTYAGQSGLDGAAAYQRDLYAAFNAEPDLASAPFYSLTLGGVGPDAYLPLGDLSNAADFGNHHIYYPEGSQPAETIDWVMGWAYRETGDLPRVVTETGYYSLLDGERGVSEQVQAKQTLNLWLDLYQGGVAYTYLYELLDGKADPAGNDSEQHYGLFRNNGSAKPVAAGIRNMHAILADTGAGASTFTPRSLSYSIQNLPGTGSSLVLQKSNGAHYVVIWNEPKIWDAASRSEIVAAPVPVTLSLNARYTSVQVYDPLSGSEPIQSIGNVNSVTLELTDHPVIVELSGTSSASLLAPAVPGTSALRQRQAGL